jgi:hypothetical protein
LAISTTRYAFKIIKFVLTGVEDAVQVGKLDRSWRSYADEGRWFLSETTKLPLNDKSIGFDTDLDGDSFFAMQSLSRSRHFVSNGLKGKFDGSGLAAEMMGESEFEFIKSVEWDKDDADDDEEDDANVLAEDDSTAIVGEFKTKSSNDLVLE